MKFLRCMETKSLIIMLVAIWVTGCQKAPVACFTVDQSEGQSPLTIHFTNTSTDAVHYKWAFNDGTSSEEMHPSHTFTYDPAEIKERFNVQLTAYGEGGESNNFSIVITARKNVKTNNPKVTDLDIMIDSIVMHYFDDPFICGLSMAILDGPETNIYHYGETRHGNGTLPNERTLYAIASVTKPFTAISLIYWLNQQDISLDAPVKDYLPADIAPGLSKDGVDITFRHLLTHTSGLPGFPSNFPFGNPNAIYDSTKLYNSIKDGVLKRIPGTPPSNYDEWKNFYSNVGFALIGILLERNCKKSLQVIFNQTILQPYAMQETEIKYIENLYNAAGGNNKGSELGYIYGHFQGIYGAGGLASNLKDLIQFAKCLIAEDGSTELGRAVMESFKDQHEVKDSKFPLGRVSGCLPWVAYLVNGEKVLFHTGALYGYSTLFSVDVKNEKAMIILNNNWYTDNNFFERFIDGLMINYYSSIP